MSLILCLESTTDCASAALIKDGHTWILKELHNSSDHARLITFFIEELLQIADLKLRDLDAVAVSKGPGSYTGLRIGVSTAKGLCYSLQLPLIAVSTLQSMAMGVLEEEPVNEQDFIVALQDARRMDAYAAIYNAQGELIKAPFFLSLEQNSFNDLRTGDNNIWICGNASDKYETIGVHPDLKFSSIKSPSAAYMEGLAQQAFEEKTFEDLAYFEPFYLKPPNITKPKSKFSKYFNN